MAGARFFQALACLTLFLVPFTDTLPNGAPQSACTNMRPGHSGTQEQPGSGPYTIQANTSTVKNGQPVAVQIMGPDFQGLLLEAREDGNTTVVGSWIHTPEKTKLLQCDQNPSGAVTHASPELKTKNDIFIWMPPNSSCLSTVNFIATVAVNFATYYVGIKSEPLQKDPAATCGSNRTADAETSSNSTTSIWTSGANTTSNGILTTRTPSSSTSKDGIAETNSSASSETLGTWVSSVLLLLAGHLFLALCYLY